MNRTLIIYKDCIPILNHKPYKSFYGSHVNLALISELLNKWGVSIIATLLHNF
jgi:hypothetical protein